MNTRVKDIELLRKLLGCDIKDNEREIFEDMLDRLDDDTRNDHQTMLSVKQRDWATSLLDIHEPTYKNEFSAGKIPIGKPVPTPSVLLNLPKRPPGRM